MVRSRMRYDSGMSSFSLIGILAATAILILLAVRLIPTTTGIGSGAATAPPGKAAPPIQRAQGIQCLNNLSQIRQAITMYRSANGKLPGSLQELASQGIVDSMMTCPVGGAASPYEYDPQRGRVGCRYPGHERY